MKIPPIILFIIICGVLLSLTGCKQKGQIGTLGQAFNGGQGGGIGIINPDGDKNAAIRPAIEPKSSDIKENIVRVANVSIDNRPEVLRMEYSAALAALNSDRPEKQSAAIAALSKLACRESVFVLGALLENKEENMKWRALGHDLIMPDGRPMRRRSRIIYEPLSHLAVKALGSLAISDLKKVGEFDRVDDGDLDGWRGSGVFHKDLFKPKENEPTDEGVNSTGQP
jgi:hypothetical protein